MNLCALRVLCGFSLAAPGNFAVIGAAAPHPLVHVNAALNLTATVLLLLGLVLIRRRREAAHKRVMLTAFGVSTAFLACYVWYHANFGSVEFTQSGLIHDVYIAILISHIVLAATVPFLAIYAIYLGYGAFGANILKHSARYRLRHRRVARWTFPIWLYVSVTGVIVYVMLYHLYPPALK